MWPSSATPDNDDVPARPLAPHPVPRVGAVVVLNDRGLEQIWGTTMGLAHMKTLEMRITWVDSVSATSPGETFPVEVDNPEITAFMIDHRCFDIKR